MGFTIVDHIGRYGYVKRTPQEIQEAIIAEQRKLNPDFQKMDFDLQANLIDTAIAGLLEFENIMECLFNAYSFNSANEWFFKEMGEELGLRMKNAYKSQVTLEFIGIAGDIIPIHTKVKSADDQYEFETWDYAVIGTTGRVSVIAYGDADTICPANKLQVFVTLLSDGIAVNNPMPSMAKIDKETFEEFKLRAQARLRSPRMGGELYAESLLKELNGVDSRLVGFYYKRLVVPYEDLGKFDENGVPIEGTIAPEELCLIIAVEAVIGGGDDYEVALALYRAFFQTQNLMSFPSDVVLDEEGNEIENPRTVSIELGLNNNQIPVKFTRPKLIELNLQLKIALLDKFVSAIAIQNACKPYMEKAINSLKVGRMVSKNMLTQIVQPAFLDIDIQPYNIQDVDWMYDVGVFKDKTDETAEPDEVVQWRAFNKKNSIDEIHHDCYCVLVRFDVNIIASNVNS